MLRTLLFFTILTLWNPLRASYDSPFPSSFQLIEDPYERLFRVNSDNQLLCTVLNTEYGVLEFYDANGEKLCFNTRNDLYNNNGNIIASAWVVSDRERNPNCWWYQSNDFCGSSRIDILTNNVPLFYMQLEGSGIVYRDAESHLPLAVVLWSDLVVKEGFFTSLFNTYSKKWSFLVIDAARLKEKEISYTLLIWALLKHIQKTLKSPEELPYVRNYIAPHS